MVFSQPIFVNNAQAPAASNELHFHCIRWQKCPTGSFQRIRIYTLSINIRRHTFLHVLCISSWIVSSFIHFDPHAIRNHGVAPIHSQFHPNCRKYMFYCITLHVPRIPVSFLKTKLSSQTSWPMPGRCWPNHQVPYLHKTYKMHAKYNKAPCTTVFSGKNNLIHFINETWHSALLGSQALLVLSLTRQCPALCPEQGSSWRDICERFICKQ